MKTKTKELDVAKTIMCRLEDKGFESYLVGGYVRDLLLGKDSKDIDITTSAKPQEVKSIFNKTIDVGIEHGTVVVIEDGYSFEVTTFRADGEYLDGRRPSSVQFSNNLKDDLIRRDLTINALAIDLEGKVIDEFGGVDDLNNKVIRSVGSPYKRFNEDALRMLRAIRFMSQLGFKMDDNTLEGIKENKQKIELISIERVYVELEKMFKGTHMKDSLVVFVESGIYKELPFFKHVNKEGVLSLKGLNLIEAVIKLTLDLGLDHEYLELIKLNKEKDFIEESKGLKLELNKGLTEDGLKMLSYKTDIKVLNLFYKLGYSLKEVMFMLKFKEGLNYNSKKDLGISSKEIMDLVDKKPGKWLGELILNLEELVITGKLSNEKGSLKSYIKDCEEKGLF